jgi:hypothetical protein
MLYFGLLFGQILHCLCDNVLLKVPALQLQSLIGLEMFHGANS